MAINLYDHNQSAYTATVAMLAETGKAAVMASTEPVVATLVGAVLFHETLTAKSALGVVLVLAAIAALNLKPRRKREPEEKSD